MALPRPHRAVLAYAVVAAALALTCAPAAQAGIFRASASPAGDRLFARQWPLSSPGGIGAVNAWWSSLGTGATVAVLDSGIDASHPDLAPNLWTNPGEVPGNGRDDDANGVVDDVHGADIIGGGGDPRDDFGHGTEISGVVAARGGNGIGISGVAPRARVMAVKVLDSHGVGNTDTLVSGLRYATAEGADVINLSVNGPTPSAAVDRAIAAAEAAGAVVVASAGNDAADRDRTPSYPAASAGGGPIAVAAEDRDHGLAYFSAFGRSAVDLAAPGEEILTTALGGGYREMAGTSAAAAHVSGAVALLAAARPAATPAELRAAIAGGARPLLHDGAKLPGGELDVSRSLRLVVPGAGPRVRVVMRRAIRSRGRTVTLRWRVHGAAGAVASYRLRVAGRRFSSLADRGGRPGRRRTLHLRPGRYHWAVDAYDASGRMLATRSARLRIL